MNDYHEYPIYPLGGSDIAALTALGLDESRNLHSQVISFGGDGFYKAYVVDSNANIGEHYKKVASFFSWLKIYDDDAVVFNSYGHWNIYRAGDYGIILQQL